MRFLMFENRAPVSMKSGLEGRNNAVICHSSLQGPGPVSMKSGLEGRNNVHNWTSPYVRIASQ